MKTKNVLVLMVMVFLVAVSVALAGSGGSHPDSKNNGLGSPRFPDVYAGPSHPQHP